MARSAIELLKRSDMFGQLTDEQLARVADLAAPQTYAEGAVIIEEDQPASRCFFVISGRVDIEIRPPYAGRGPQRIAQIKAGEVFGELSLVDGFLRSATARAVEPVEALVFENEKLEALLEEDPKIGYRVMRNIANILSARIRTTNMKLRNAISDVLYY